MLYALHDMTSRSLAPLAAFARMGSWLTSAPLIPFSRASTPRQAHAGFELLERLSKTYAKPGFRIKEVSVAGESVAVDELVALDAPFCKLVHFAKRQANRGAPLLVVAPMSGHHATLLRDTVQTLLARHDVYITDWKDARDVPLKAGRFDLADYARYVQDCIRAIGPGVHVLAVCQPCVPVLAAISLMEQSGEALVPKSLTLIAGPVDARQSPTAVNKFAADHELEYFKHQIVEKVPMTFAGRGRLVYPGFKQLTAFVMMNRDKHTAAYREFYEAVAAGQETKADKHRQFYDEYNAVMDMPGEYYLETIEKVFKSHDLARGELHLAGQLVAPSAISRTALLTIEGEQDDITGAGQTHAAQKLCSGLDESSRQTLTVPEVGHYGAFSGSRFRTQIAPAVGDFIDAHR